MNDTSPTPDSPETESAVVEPAQVERQHTPSPFDHPLSFPALLLVLGLWFGYDGWLNPETKSVGFNRIMFGVFALAFVWTLRIGVLEIMETRSDDQSEQGDS